MLLRRSCCLAILEGRCHTAGVAKPPACLHAPCRAERELGMTSYIPVQQTIVDMAVAMEGLGLVDSLN